MVTTMADGMMSNAVLAPIENDIVVFFDGVGPTRASLAAINIPAG